MRFRILDAGALAMLMILTGCESPWYEMEPIADTLIPPTNYYVGDASRQEIAAKMGRAGDVSGFGDHAVYMGDKDGSRYVHVRDIYDFWGFLGECDYKIPESQWPMDHPQPLTHYAQKWQDVRWMGSDAPEGVEQSPFLHITPSFPMGAPKTQPAEGATQPTGQFIEPMTTRPGTKPAPVPATQPSSQPG